MKKEEIMKEQAETGKQNEDPNQKNVLDFSSLKKKIIFIF